MNTKKTLADVQPGGRVRLGDRLPPIREDEPLRGDEPVGEQHDARMYNRGWNSCREAAATLTARQPVGEPVGHIYQGSSRIPQAFLSKELPVGTLLYVAPPAQAVDLEQFREAVAEWRSNWASYGRTMTSAGRDTSKARRNVDEADRLLALIDSQAVGK